MIILQANKIERSFAGEVLFDNISLQVDERDRIALVGKNGAGKSTLLKILVGEEEPTSGEINKKRDLSLSYLAQDSRFESSNTIYDEMLHVFDDLRKTEKTLRQMELEMGEKTGADLEKLMQDYDRLSEEFRQAGGFTYEADIRAILNGFKFDESMWQMKISELSGGQNTRLALAKMLLEKPLFLQIRNIADDPFISLSFFYPLLFPEFCSLIPSLRRKLLAVCRARFMKGDKIRKRIFICLVFFGHSETSRAIFLTGRQTVRSTPYRSCMVTTSISIP